MSDQIKRINIHDVAEDYPSFLRKLDSGELPMPCWLEVGHSAFKVTHENHKALALGMTLYLCVIDELR